MCLPTLHCVGVRGGRPDARTRKGTFFSLDPVADAITKLCPQKPGLLSERKLHDPTMSSFTAQGRRRRGGEKGETKGEKKTENTTASTNRTRRRRSTTSRVRHLRYSYKPYKPYTNRPTNRARHLRNSYKPYKPLRLGFWKFTPLGVRFVRFVRIL